MELIIYNHFITVLTWKVCLKEARDWNLGLSFKNENLSVSDLELNVGIDSVVVFKQRTTKSDLSLIITDQAKEKRRPKRIYFISREIICHHSKISEICRNTFTTKQFESC